MHNAWKVKDVLECILDAVAADSVYRKPSLAALAATCKTVYEQSMDRLWVDMTVFDLVSSIPYSESCPVRRAPGKTSLMVGGPLLESRPVG